MLAHGKAPTSHGPNMSITSQQQHLHPVRVNALRIPDSMSLMYHQVAGSILRHG